MGQLRDLFGQVDRPDDQSDLGIFVILARLVGDTHEPFEGYGRFVARADANIVRSPTDAAREIADLDDRFSVEFALHVPIQHLRLVVRKGGVE